MNGLTNHRIVVLCEPNTVTCNTAATLIKNGLNVVGICMMDQRTRGLPISYVLRSVRRNGLWVTVSRVLARLLYLLLNYRRDRGIFRRLYNEQDICETLRTWSGEIFRTERYSNQETLAWLQAREPDILVAHTGYWVPKKVLQMPGTGFVLGGHPGITPYYRGSHSAFWAIYHGKPEDVGCTIFLMDEGFDTGEIVAQERISIEEGDSFVTLGWKGMIREAEMQAAVLCEFDGGKDIPHRSVPVVANSYFDNPTLGEYLRYIFKQRHVR